MEIQAERLEYTSDEVVSAVGDARVRYGETELRADRVEWNRRTGWAKARGSVRLFAPEGHLEARELEVDLRRRTGVVRDGTFVSTDGYLLRGQEIEKGLGRTYRIGKGEFTPCLCESGVPSWSLSAEDFELVGGEARVRGAKVQLRNCPVFYVPKAVFPVTRERRSGFLLPYLGFSDRRQFQILLPFYWAIDRSHDATFGLDLETRARVGALGQYRYARRRDSRGRIDVAYFDESFRSRGDRKGTDGTIGRGRWSVDVEATQGLPGSAELLLDGLWLGDDLLLRETNVHRFEPGDNVYLRTLRYTESRAVVSRGWSRGFLALRGAYYQSLGRLPVAASDLLEEAERDRREREKADDLTLQEAPELSFRGQKLLSSWVQARVSAVATNFVREKGIDGFRLDLAPTLAFPVRFLSPVRAEFRLGFRETAYVLREDRMRGGLDPDSVSEFVLDLPRTVSREVADLGFEMTTELGRVYRWGAGGSRRWKHTVEPFLAYDFVPEVGQDDLPLFDALDRVNRRNLLTFGFRSRILGRTEGKSNREKPTSVRELVRVAVFQSVDFEREIAPVGEPPGGPGSDHFSDLDLSLDAEPFPWLRLRAQSGYDRSDNDVSSAAVAFRVEDPRRRKTNEGRRLALPRTTFTAGYRFITQGVLQQVDASLLFPLGRFLGAFAATRYDVQNDRVLENTIGLRWISRCDCWALDAGFTDKTNPDEIEFRLQLTLVGLGAPVSVGRGFEPPRMW